MDTAMDGLTDRLDGFGLAGAPSTTPENSLPPFNAFSGFPSPIRSPFQPTGTAPPPSMGVANGGIDIPSIPRRFTTDVGKFPWGGAFHGSRGASVSVLPDISSSFDFLSPYEKKLQHIEQMREQRRQLEEMFDLQQEREQQELNQLARDLAHAQQAQQSLSQYQIQNQKNGGQQQQQQQQATRALNSSGSSAFSSASASAFSSGNASEPTTPPLAQNEPTVEDNRGFPSSFSRPRFSTSSIGSTGWFNPFGSPPSQQKEARDPAQLKSLSSIGSAPGSALSSRRNSDDEAFVPDPLTDYRPSVGFNRYSMPVSGLSSKLQATAGGGSSFPSTLGLGSLHHRKNVFTEEPTESGPGDISTPEVNNYLKMTDPDEKSFPTLRSDRLSGLLSANPIALDLANSPTPVPQPEPEHTTYRRTAYNRDRAYHQSISLPSHTLGFLGPQPTSEISTRPLSTDSTQLAYDPFVSGQATRPRQQSSFSSSNRTRAHTTMNEGTRPVTPPHGRRESVGIASPANGGFGFGSIPFSPEGDRRRQSTFLRLWGL
ncbi:hypothetical protein KEM56_005917 [Ascosphaera pollenicola]|nr:hypothetical protein KEM56_005917 [Ascosphaera pollenicola]